jgi:hypothetical protein
MIAAFAQLEAKTRIGELTLGQWAGVIAGALVALAIAGWAQPTGSYWDLALGVYAGGIPAGLAITCSLADINPLRLAWLAWRWRRAGGLYEPGPGEAHGYELTGSPTGATARAGEPWEALWA